MLAQLNSKQKSLFFNIKPTVIDRLISKNKSSIQNSLLCTNEDSDGSVSEESEESSSSSQESSVTALEHPPAMAPIRRSEKVLGSKLSSRSHIPLKKGRSNPPSSQQGRSSSNLVITARKLLENRRRGRPRKVVRDVRSPKDKKNSEEVPSTSTKRSRTSVKKEEGLPIPGRSKLTNANEDKSLTVKRKPKGVKGVKEVKVTSVNENKSPSLPESGSLALINTKSSPRKFPSNVLDRWKSTGMVIRGRGRPRGSVKGACTTYRGRGASFRGRGISLRGRGGVRVGALRSERYITRDSQIGVMRSGKLRKYSTSDLVEGLVEHSRKRRKVLNRVKVEKSDYPSDEHSSFVTTSELSFCENDNSFKQSDDELVNSRLLKVKEEIAETEDETVDSRDTNSNLFKSDNIKKENKLSSSGSDTNEQSNNSKIVRKNLILGPKNIGRGRKRIISLERRVLSQSDSSVRDSDCSLDSDVMEDNGSSTKSGLKLHKRRKIDGVWVRRSTRSVGKSSVKVESDVVVIEELLQEKDCLVDLESNSKSSLIVGVENSKLPETMSSGENESSFPNCTSEEVTGTSVQKSVNICNLVTGVQESSEKCPPRRELAKSEINLEVDSNEISASKDDSIEDFYLTLEETPVKKTTLILETNSVPSKLLFESPGSKKDVSHDINKSASTVNPSNAIDGPIEKKLVTCNKISKEPIQLEMLLDCSSDGSQCLLQLPTTSVNIDPNFPPNKSNDEKDPITLDIKPMLEDGLNDLENKCDEQVCNSREVLSDENILSMIDSFCSQSDTTDVSTDEVTQESTIVENDEEVILESLKQLTCEVENKLLKDKDLQDLTSTINNLSDKIVSSCMENKVISASSRSDILSEEDNCSKQVIEKSSASVDLIALSNETKNNETEFIGNDKQENPETINICKEEINDGTIHFCKEEVSSTYETLDIDNRIMDKAPEITEESSSSDSNSNLSEVTSISIEKDSASAMPTDGDLQLQSDIEGSKPPRLVDRGDEGISTETLPGETPENSFSSVINSNIINEIDRSNKDITHVTTSLSRKSSTEDNLEERPSKELLSALGLQSLHSTVEEKPKRPNDSYTGTLKAVIKLNRSSDKRSGGRKIIFKQGDKLSQDIGGGGDRLEYRICSAEEISAVSVPLTHLADIPANRKAQIKVKSQFDLSNSPNIVGSSGSAETSSDSTKDQGGKQNLIIPEKSSSFSIHPERLCTDVCSYCFGKFGSLDTPCHLAQLKNSERQAKILAIEVHLSADSCLCDGCFRYVDRKANCPASQRSRKPAARRGPLAGTVCAVQECSQPARHSVRRKWLIKLKKSIGKKLVIDMDKNPHLPFPLCSQHYYWVDYFTVCGICKKRLTRNHMYALGPEAEELNQALSDDGIPVRLSDKLFLCKLCRYYGSLRLKYRDPTAMSSTHRLFLSSYRKKILLYHDIPVSESEEEGKPVEEERGVSEPFKTKKKKSKSKSLDGHESKKRTVDKEGTLDHGAEDQSNDSQMIDYSYLDTLNIHREEATAPLVDYSSLGDFEEGFSNIASFLNPLETGQGTVHPSDPQNRNRVEKPTRIQVKFGNLNIGKLSNLNIGQDSRPASNTTPALERPPYLPGERDLKLNSEFEFHGTLNQSSGWERCTSTIQFDKETKKLWQELQRPYGNQSSFLRHLVILEKHWRNGSLVMAENANPRAVKYITSVKNRVQAYDGGKSTDVEKPKQAEATVVSPPPRPVSTPVRGAPPPLMKIAPGSTPWLHEQLRKPPAYTSTPSVSTSSRPAQPPAPPPYRLPVQTTKQTPRPVRVPTPMPPLLKSPLTPNIRPLSLSFQQFKRIRLEQPPASASLSQVTVIPKVEPPAEMQTSSSEASSSTNFSPRICDVRSLASPTSDWNESFRKQQQKMLKQNIAKYYTPILPKIPNSLTVTTFPQTTALVMKTSSLTIEKAPSVNTKPSLAPPEKPSISVFRETTPSDNG